MPPPPIRGQMVCRRRPGRRRRTPPRSPRQSRLPHPTIAALGRGSRRAAAASGGVSIRWGRHPVVERRTGRGGQDPAKPDGGDGELRGDHDRLGGSKP